MALTLVAALAGCGDVRSDAVRTTNDKAASTTSAGSTTEHDRVAIAAVLEDLRAHDKHDAGRSAALEKDRDFTNAIAAIERMFDSLFAAQNHILDVDDATTRKLLNAYVAALLGAAAAIDRMYAYYDDDRGLQDDDVEEDLETRLGVAYEKAEAAGNRLVRRLREAASPEQRKRLGTTIRAVQRNYARQASG